MPLPHGLSQHESSVASSQTYLPPPGYNHENRGAGRVIASMTLLLCAEWLCTTVARCDKERISTV